MARAKPKKTAENIANENGVAAEVLKKAGFDTVAKIARAQTDILAEKAGFDKALARTLISAAKNTYSTEKKASSAKQRPVTKQMHKETLQTLKKRSISEVMKDERFRRRVVYYIVKELF